MKNSLHLKCMLALFFIFSFAIVKAQTQCGVDTVNYTYQKTTQFRGVSLNATTSGNAFAQWFPAPQKITIEGFDFYAWQSAGTNDTVSLTCNLYRAGADSLPFGGALRSIVVKVDSTFGSGVLTTLIKHAVFDSAITLNFPYVVTVENTSSVNVSVLSNDYAAFNPNGRGEWLSSVRIGANYLRSYDVNVGGVAFDADFIFRPHVKYTIESDFSFVGCNSGGNTINFKNNHSPVFSSPFYNRYAYFNIQRICHRWNYGDNGGVTLSIDGTKNYSTRADYNITLYDTLYGWFRGCADSIKKTIYATPNAPKINNNSPVCSGDSLKLSVDTVANTSYVWASPTSFLTTSPDTVFVNSDTSLNGVYTVAAIKNGCPSFSVTTTVVVNQTPEKPDASNDGAKCVGDKSVFKITSPDPTMNYHWSGPAGFISNSTTFTFNNVDTTLRGDYIVFVEDGLCQSEADTVNFFIYPPPQPPTISAKKITVCERDTLFLIGNSVQGALFNWSGPNGFFSTATNPTIVNSGMTNAGKYTAFVKIGSCSSTKDSVTITVNPSPTATISAGTTTFCDGDSTTLSATPTTGLTYQWQRDSVDILNADAENITAKTTGNYRAIVTNTFSCSDVSQGIDVTVKPLPTLTLQPVPQLAKKDWDVSFEVNSPDVGVNYQWQEDKGNGFNNLTNSIKYNGANTKKLTINDVDDSYNTYQYRCILTLAGCETASNAGVLNINVGFGELPVEEVFKIYPNPASDVLSINIKLSTIEEVKFTVTDVLGKEHISPRTFIADGGQQHIDISQLAKGVYFLKLRVGSTEKAVRFIVQ
jgi:hypothetical protein